MRAIPRDLLENAHTKPKKLFVGGVTEDMTPDELQEYIESRHPPEYGTILKYDFLKVREIGKNKGFGFLECSSQEFADRLTISEQHFVIKGKKMGIKKAEPKPGEEPQGFGGRGGGRGGMGGGRGGRGGMRGGQQGGGYITQYPNTGYGGGYAQGGYGGGGQGGYGSGYGGGSGYSNNQSAGSYNQSAGGYGQAGGDYGGGAGGYGQGQQGGYGAANGQGQRW